MEMDLLRTTLETLNGPQRKAAEHLPDGPLQILAGPGSGKTKVLTTRIAYLIIVHGIPPYSICAVTFTNKAANEMRERLVKLIGPRRTKQLKMGTFHALCARLLRQGARSVGLTENFTILDADDSEKLVGKLMKPYAKEMLEEKCTYTKKDVHSKISRSKNKGFDPDEHIQDLLRHCNENIHNELHKITEEKLSYAQKLVVKVWREYEKELRKSNCVDFDDLLIYGVQLVKTDKKAVKWCQHVLVDEYQDTNSMQYQLMRYIAKNAGHDYITIVGDPDQSIYGWRSADIRNLSNMQTDFPQTQQIYLEENYRSTASIIDISHAIISQDKKRVQKELHTTHPLGPRPMLCWFETERAESLFIAAEIKRLVATSGGMLKWQDFAILLRSSFMSRNIEAALQIEGIPNRMHKGHKFFERAEIKDILAYLQIVDNHKFLPAFTRTVNLPPRGIGEKSVAQLVARAEKENISALEVAEAIYDGKAPDIKPAVKKKLGSYIKIIRELRKAADARMGPCDLIDRVIELTDYMEYLEKGENFEMRRENVLELTTFAQEQQSGGKAASMKRFVQRNEGDPAFPGQGQVLGTDSDNPDHGQPNAIQLASEYLLHPARTSPRRPADIPDEVIEINDSSDEDGPVVKREQPVDETAGRKLPSPDDEEQELGEDQDDPDVKAKVTPLREFLQNSMLSTDTETNKDDGKDKVLMSTCHSAKGLEWPVVFIPGVEIEIFPHKRADRNEERRLLYVAATRAQGLLYVLHCGKRMMGGNTEVKQLSPFIYLPLRESKHLMSPTLPELNETNRAILAEVLHRPEPDSDECARRTAEFDTSILKERLQDLISKNFPWPEGARTNPSVRDQRVLVPATAFPANMGEHLGTMNGGSSSFGTAASMMQARVNGTNTNVPRDATFHGAGSLLGAKQNSPPAVSETSHYTACNKPQVPKIRAERISLDSNVASSSKLKQPEQRTVHEKLFEESVLVNSPKRTQISSDSGLMSSSLDFSMLVDDGSIDFSVLDGFAAFEPPTSDASPKPGPSNVARQNQVLPSISITPAKPTAVHEPPLPGPSRTEKHNHKARQAVALHKATPNSRPALAPSRDALKQTQTPPSGGTKPMPPQSSSQASTTPAPAIGTKRRLGMGRPAMGYSNKKFKVPGT